MSSKFLSILDHIGQVFKTVFTDATKIATIAEPIVDLAFPTVASLYNFTVQQAALAEAAAAGAVGSGPQKLAAVVTAVTPYAASVLKTDGVPAPTSDQITAYVNAVVATMKALPAPVAPTPTPVEAANEVPAAA